MPKKTYAISEAVRRLRISKQAVLEAIKSGRLKAKRITIQKSVWRIDAESIDQYQISQSHRERGKKND